MKMMKLKYKDIKMISKRILADDFSRRTLRRRFQEKLHNEILKMIR